MEFIWIFFIIAFAIFHKSETLLRKFEYLKKIGLDQSNKYPEEIITKESLKNLPTPIQKYLEYVEVVGKPKVYNFKLKITADMKTDYYKEYMKSDIIQYSFEKGLMRLVFMRMNYKGLPIIALHSFYNKKARMKMKILGLFTVADVKDEELQKAETVTLFNDMCILAPSLLIDANIKWKVINDYTVIGEFNNGSHTISGTLLFNKDYQLINFISNDRFYSKDGEKSKNVRWSTPISQYRNINGYNLSTQGRAYWHFESKDFCYMKLNIKDIEYNIKY